jgi:hypothetical protein
MKMGGLEVKAKVANNGFRTAKRLTATVALDKALV